MIISANHSAILSASFDWGKDARTGKVTTGQEAFKYDTRRLAQGGGSELNYPYEVVDTRLRIRGAGRVLRLRYESSEGKDLRLLGYSIMGIEQTDSEGSK